MSGSSFVARQLDFIFEREDGGVFADGGTNTVTLSGLRASVTLKLSGGPSFNDLTAKIYGLTPSMMADLSTLGMLILLRRKNTVSVYAGDSTTGLGFAFSGTVFDAWANYESMPQVSFDITARTAGVEALTPISPSSYRSVDVVTLISSLATIMHRNFENNGVPSIMLTNPVLAGTAPEQIRDAAEHANIEWHDDNKTISIWPRGASREGVVPLVSPATGLVGYPKYTVNGLDIITVFNPNIVFGGRVRLESSVPQATGTWVVYGMVHNLEAQTPGGSWFSAIRLMTPGQFGGFKP